jgi:ribosomal 30S subunit maturation factor RimM
MNKQLAKNNMIKQQLRTNAVLDTSILELYQSIDREAFVPHEYRAFAYSDMQIPLNHQQQMLTPLEEALILQALALKGARILVTRDAFPKTDSDSYYWVDLIGCQANNVQGEALGTVIDVTEHGAHGVIVIGDVATNVVKQLVPFVKEVVQNVDLANKTITLDWQSDW